MNRWSTLAVFWSKWTCCKRAGITFPNKEDSTGSRFIKMRISVASHSTEMRDVSPVWHLSEIINWRYMKSTILTFWLHTNWSLWCISSFMHWGNVQTWYSYLKQNTEDHSTSKSRRLIEATNLHLLKLLNLTKHLDMIKDEGNNWWPECLAEEHHNF